MIQARKKLGRYIIAAFFLNIFAIMSVGALCILLVGDMLHNIKKIKVESNDVFITDNINNKVYQVIYAIDKAIIKTDRTHLNYARDIIVDLIDEVSTFIADRQAFRPDPVEHEKLQEIYSLLKTIKVNVNNLLETSETDDYFDQQIIRDLEKMGISVQILSEELHDYRAPKITALVDDSFEKMEFILLLYLLSSSIGIFASFVAYTVLTRNTVVPIMDLAEATKEVANGDLSVRVNTRSETEIGALYESFNLMTAKLELYEREREEFNRELGELVEERTRELQEANKNLRKTQSELVRLEKIATLGQIAASVNHEIKTPLNSLYLNLQLLTKKINKHDWQDQKTHDSLLAVTSIIDNEILRISEILEEFVQYARFAPPKLKLEDINKIINELAMMIQETATNAKVDLNLNLGKDPLTALMDRKKITQALMNLCVNAIHAMPDGGNLTIRTDTPPGNGAMIRITDSGTGISEEDLEKIFEPFFTKKEKGMGFGLPIVKRIIEDHKGTITCRSKGGEFTEFTIILPPAEEVENKS